MKSFQLATFIVLVLGISIVSPTAYFQIDDSRSLEITAKPHHDADFIPSDNYEEMNLSTLYLSLYLNETDATVLGNMTIEYYNSDPLILSSIPFHLYLSGMYAEGRLGYIEILNVTALSPNPVPLVFDVYSPDQLMWVHLDDDLQPNAAVTLEISFISVLPIDSPDRAGVSGTDIDSSKIFEYASAYPIPCVYDEYDGWNTDPYLDTGDPFYLDMAFYNISLIIPNGMKVAATGELMQTDVGATETTCLFTPSSPVREFTFCTSRYYVTESQIYRGVNVTSYYLPESIGLWSSNGLTWGVRALALFNDTFGAYPYTTLNIVEDFGFYYGMEYPCQVYLSNIINDRYQASQISADTLDAVIAHEVAHQWWYHLVGNDEVDVGFLDEGLAVWSTYYYSEFYNLGWPGKDDDFYFVKMYYPGIINQSIYDNASTYYFTAYTKTPVVLEKLRQMIGLDDYLDSLRLYFSRCSYKIAFLQDLQAAFEDQLNTDLDWFFVPMFDNGYLPEYSFKSVDFNSTARSLSIVIEDLNEGLHVRKYLQNFSIVVETTTMLMDWAVLRYYSTQNIVFTNIQLHGTTQITLTDYRLATYTPTKVTLLYDEYSLVQLHNPDVRSISTSDITILVPTTPPSSSPTTTTEPTEPPWDPTLTVYLLSGAAIGILVLGIIVLVRKRNRI